MNHLLKKALLFVAGSWLLVGTCGGLFAVGIFIEAQFVPLVVDNGSRHAVRVLVNGQDVGEVAAGETKEFSLSPGHGTVGIANANGIVETEEIDVVSSQAGGGRMKYMYAVSSELPSYSVMSVAYGEPGPVLAMYYTPPQRLFAWPEGVTWTAIDEPFPETYPMIGTMKQARVAHLCRPFWADGALGGCGVIGEQTVTDLALLSGLQH